MLSWGDADVVPFPSFADALYLSFYPAAYVGIWLLLRSQVGRLPAGLWLDGVIGGLAVAALGAALVFGAVLSATHGAALTVATNLAYPLADLLLLGLLVGIMAVTGFNVRGEWLLIAIGFAVFAVADSIYLVQTADNTYVSERLARRRLAGGHGDHPPPDGGARRSGLGRASRVGASSWCRRARAWPASPSSSTTTTTACR